MTESKVLYNQIGAGYNTTRQADPYLTERLFRLLSPSGEGLYLDIGCGTGNYTIALADKGLQFVGVEPSLTMLDIAKAKNQEINWLCAKAEALPLNAETFDGAMATLTIHHWTDLQAAMKAVYRVLKTGSKLVIFTADPQQMRGYWLNHYFPVMLEQSIKQMPAFERVKDAIEAAGFELTATEKYFIQDDLQDFFLYSGKNKPSLYLDEQVRNGISSFSALANKEEAECGLLMLNKDIASGQFAAIKEEFNNDDGDYLFIIATKE